MNDDFVDTTFSKAYLDWILKQNISYRSASSEDTRRMFTLVRPGIEKAMYTSHGSLSRLVVSAYKNRQLEIKDRLLIAKSRITVSCDVWTSTNHLSLLGIVAHFIDDKDRRQSTLIGLPRLFGSHDGENLAETLYNVINKYEFGYKIGCFMMDNAYNNDTMMDHLCRKIPTLQRQARLRCAGHIFNLIVKAILYGKEVTEFERKILGCSDREHFNLWRRFGAIGKVHNFVKWACRSNQRREEFGSYQPIAAAQDELFDWTEKMLIKDGGVRWNSTYLMLKRAKLHRRAIELFQKDHNELEDDEDSGYSVREDRLTKDDWEEIDRFLVILEPITFATKYLEGNPGVSEFGSLWAIFPALNMLSEQLDLAINNTKDEPESYFKSGILMGKQKLDQYWDKVTTETPFYFAATVLHPSLKQAYFQDKWRKYPEWQKRAKMQTEKIYEEYVADAHMEEEVDVREEVWLVAPLNDHLTTHKNFLRAHLQVDEQYSSHGRSNKRQRIESELNKYIDDGLVDLDTIGDDPLPWWLEQARSSKNSYPTLTRMAFDLFSIPAMSAECERVFSQAGKVVTDERNRLDAATIEANECQRAWLLRDLVSSEL